MQLPQLLVDSNDDQPLEVLSCYYGLGKHAEHDPFTGSWFDSWDTTGHRDNDGDRYTADDLVAVTCLSVDVPAKAAVRLLDTEAETFGALLTELGPDRDLVAETNPWPDDWAGWRLWQQLMALPDVGATTASKLYARKRPRLRPIYDSVVARVIGSTAVWEPLRVKLQDDAGLHPRLVGLRDEIGLPSQVSPLRVFDVVTWMEGKGWTHCPWPQPASG